MTPSKWATLLLAVSNVLVGVVIGWNLAEAKHYRDERLRVQNARRLAELLTEYLNRRMK